MPLIACTVQIVTIGEGEELTKGRNVQLLAVQVYLQCGARGVRGAVFRDIVNIATSILTAGGNRPTFYYLIAFCQFIINEYVILCYQSYGHTDTSTDNKGRLNIAACETKMLSILYCAAMDTNVECNELNLI